MEKVKNQSKAKKVKCFETGEIFSSASKAGIWLLRNNKTLSPQADRAIKDVCHKRQKSAYGYHWEFIEE